MVVVGVAAALVINFAFIEKPGLPDVDSNE